MKPVKEAQKDVKKSISGLLLTERSFLMCCWSLNNTGSNCVSLLIPSVSLFSVNKYYSTTYPVRASRVALVVRNPPTNAEDSRDVGSIPGSGRSPGKGNGNPLQCSCLGNPMDRGAWWATVHGVMKKSWTRLSTHTV